MEVLSSFTALLLLSSFIFLLIKACACRSQENPTPPGLPVIGHLHHLVGRLPHQALSTIAEKYGPILHLRLGQVSAVLISSPEAAKQVLKDQDPACADKIQSIGTKIMWYDFSDLVFSPYNGHWRQMRRICVSELLSLKKVKSFRSIRQEEVSFLVEFLRSSSGLPVNITDKLFELNSSIVCRASLGKVTKDCDVMIAMLRKATTMATGFELVDLFPSSKLANLLTWNKYKLLRMRRKLDKILDGILEEHILKPRDESDGEDDIVDVLLRLKNSEELQYPITDHTIKGIIFDMFAAGTDTSSTILDWAMAELMRNPGAMAKLQQEIRQAFKEKKLMEEKDMEELKYLKLVIKETLRLHPPIALMRRTCRDECTVDGYSIPLKTRILVNTWCMGRDPKYWDHPENFQPERFEDNGVEFLGNNFEFIPFGAGKRICPGMNFGLVSIELALTQLLYHFDWKMPHGMRVEDVDMTERSGITVSRKNGLVLVPLLHISSD